jgi:hypothetical protein
MISRRNRERLGDTLAVGATHYHASPVHPTWAPKKLRVTQIGNHIFYRDRVTGVGAAFRGSIQ